MRVLVVFFLSLAIGCIDVTLDDSETDGNLPPIDGPTIEFNPSGGVVPFPNSLLIDRTTGLVNLPEQCNESATSTALRTMVLNALDGFGTFKPALAFTLTEPVDMASLTDKVKLYRRTDANGPIDPATATEVPTVLVPGLTQRFTADCSDSSLVDRVVVVPAIPLADNSVYTIAILDGVTTANGESYIPSVVWGLVRQSVNPVAVGADGMTLLAESTPFDPLDPADVATLLGVDLLWKAHASGLAFLDGALGAPREDIVLAWDFKTETILEQFDAAVANSPRSALGSSPIAGLTAIDGGNPAGLIDTVLGAGTCAALGTCAAVGSIRAGAVTSPNFQIDTTNPLSGGDPVPGSWSDPRTPAQNGSNTANLIAFVPATAAPAGGYPVIIFGHGITRSKFDVFAVGSQFAAAGFATVAIDWVKHGDPNSALPAGRGVQTDDQGICAGTPDPSDTSGGGATCFAQFFSSDLGGTRDNFRQSAIDVLGLVEAVKACTGNACGAGFNLDSGRIGYFGHSLGGIIGAIVVSQSTDIKGAVLNVTGVGLTDVIENTAATAFLQCPLVDALIAAGVLPGTASNPVAMTGTCFEEDFTAFPEWQAFAAVARIVLDAGDPVNFIGGLLGRPVLVQEVDDDGTVPNVSTATLGALLGLSPETADTNTGTASASAAVDGQAAHIRYVAVPAASPFPGNTYGHGSILSPAGGGADGALGTAQMQTDAIAHFLITLAP
jgi:dienelactone hydrolase